MNNAPFSNNNSSRQLHIWQLVDNWRHLPQEVIKRMPKRLKADMSERVVQSAETRLADVRIDDMATTANRQPSPSAKNTTKIIVVVVGALTFSAGTQVLTSRLGPAALPAAMIGGALASYLVDDRAIKVMTKARAAHSTKQAINAIERQKPSHLPVSELGELFYSTQTGLVQQIEGKNLEKQLAIDGILAACLSAAEFTVSLWIVAQLGLPGGILIEAIAASLPVTIIWIAAAFQSDRFELPEHYADMIEKYLPHLFPPEGMPEAEIQELLTNKEAQEVRLDWLVKFVAEGDEGGRLKNLGMATADFDINLVRDRKYQLERERDRALEQHLFQHRARVAELPNQFPVPSADITGWPPQQIKAHWQKVEQQRLLWVQQQTAELEELLAQDLKMMARRYETQINQCEEEIAAAQQRYDEAHRNWKDDNEEFEGDLDDAA